MRFDFKFFSIFFIVVFLSLSFFVGLVNAGVLHFNVRPGSQGSVITVSWSQGCPSYNLGPDQCSSNKPLYCPKTSKGTSNDVLVNNCQKCGCPTDYECKSSGLCQLCPDPCNPNPCSPGETCTTVDRCAQTYTCDSSSGGGSSGGGSSGGSSGCTYSGCGCNSDINRCETCTDSSSSTCVSTCSGNGDCPP